MNYETFRANCVDTDGTDLFPIIVGLNLFSVACIAAGAFIIHRINTDPITEEEHKLRKAIKRLEKQVKKAHSQQTKEILNNIIETFRNELNKLEV